MAPSRKNTSQAATTVASNAKLTVVGGVRPSDAYPPHLDVLIKDVEEGQSSPPTAMRAEVNGHEIGLPIEGQLIQMFSDLQKQVGE